METAETAVWAGALRRLRRVSGAAVGFGGAVEQGTLRLSQFDGTRTAALDGLQIVLGRGLGGKAWHERSAMGVDDYGRSASISHDYDGPVRAEGMRAIVAAPVVVGNAVRGVVYAGTREAVGYGDRFLEAVTRTGQWLAREISLEEEVSRRVARRTEELRRAEATASERLRRTHARLSQLRATADDPRVREQMARLLADLEPESAEAPVLTARELDVLTQVATGASYPQVAERLGISPQTVKSYMRDLIARLGAHSRHEAVVIARGRGWLP